MNWLDFVILALIVISIFSGLKDGIIKGAFSLAGLIVGIALAGRYYLPLAERLPFVPQGRVAEVVAFVIILAVVAIVAALLAKAFSWVASAITLGWLNHLGGAVFGFVIGAISVAALLALWVKFFGVNQTITDSSLAVLLLKRFPAILALLPAEFDVIREFFK
ncbi:MAG: CvpA family protein [Chloroflexi bacterium]|nr:CvpA family protein [Chloroflexota bacterium]